MNDDRDGAGRRERSESWTAAASRAVAGPVPARAHREAVDALGAIAGG